jgi:hypothetical protein
VIRLVGDRAALPTGDHLTTSSQGETFNLLLGIGDGISDGHHLPASSQGKTVNLLLGIGDGISGRLRSTPCGSSRGTPDGRLRKTSNLETVCWGDRESIHGLKAKVGLKPTSFVIL